MEDVKIVIINVYDAMYIIILAPGHNGMLRLKAKRLTRGDGGLG